MRMRTSLACSVEGVLVVPCAVRQGDEDSCCPRALSEYSSISMPLYMDRHDLPDATAADIAEAHVRDREVQERFGVHFVTYSFEEEAGSAFCLVEAPDKEAVEAAHGAAHGMLPANVVEVDEANVRGFFGRLNTHPLGEPYVESAFERSSLPTWSTPPASLSNWGIVTPCGCFASTTRSYARPWRSSAAAKSSTPADGIMAAFTLASQAVRAAIQVQRALLEHNETERSRLHVRIGVAAGRPS